jgi:hypothetical protein
MKNNTWDEQYVQFNIVPHSRDTSHGIEFLNLIIMVVEGLIGKGGIFSNNLHIRINWIWKKINFNYMNNDS